MKTVNRFGPQEQLTQGCIPDVVQCFCGGTLIRYTRSSLDGMHDVICWPHHLCGTCGIIIRFTKDGYTCYDKIVNPKDSDSKEIEDSGVV